MSRFVRAAQTSQSLSLAAMEEASRFGLREADIEHMFLALAINDQAAGRAMRSLEIDLAKARHAVEEQREAQLASLGVGASFPSAGRIVFHETSGYEWSKRATDLLARSAGKDKDGDASAVLRELVAEPSGLIADILRRLQVAPDALLERLDHFDSTDRTPVLATTKTKVRGRVSGSIETFVAAPVDEVWELLADPTNVPVWEMSLGSIDDADQDAVPGTVWLGHAPTSRPDGKAVKVRAQFARRNVELVASERPRLVAWSFHYPDASRSRPVLTEFTLAATTGGTQVRITTSWSRSRGWRMLVGIPLRPIQKFFVWIGLFQTGSAISRVFR